MSALATEQAVGHWKHADEIEVLTFDMGRETFALEAVIVQEILDLLPETPVPGARPFVASVINFRGKVIPLADLRLAFGMPAAEATIDSRIVVIELLLDGEPTLVGLRADKVNETTTLTKEASEPPPSLGMRWRPDYIDCVVKRGSDFIIIPNLKALFSGADSRAPAAEAN
ncbi:chemotaxis protein CheW [Roseibium aggregatum]|uniref:Chemotaxis protein CheW n=1 Tax=Roseibium aggregatum TaxID=187304 RepID=A0A926P1I0_9HYPH|nr:chemotaxis protein CheW [Roseibium aggregatum]MBD1544712.1 chemotaxis protein CheW [Roseibium aggregatum]